MVLQNSVLILGHEVYCLDYNMVFFGSLESTCCLPFTSTNGNQKGKSAEVFRSISFCSIPILDSGLHPTPKLEFFFDLALDSGSVKCQSYTFSMRSNVYL